MASGTCRLISKYCSSIGVSLVKGPGILLRLPNVQQSTILDAQLDHQRLPQTGVRHPVQQHHPPGLGCSFTGTRAGDVHDLAGPQATRRARGARAPPPPARLGRRVAGARTGDVHALEVPQATRFGDGQSALPRLDGEDPPLRTRRIFETAQREEKDRADGQPDDVRPGEDAPEHAAIIRAVTRGEIEEQLKRIVQQEKTVPEELLTPETPLE